jgi:hypothetical protein
MYSQRRTKHKYFFLPGFPPDFLKINTQNPPKFSQKKLKKNYLIFSAGKSAEVRRRSEYSLSTSAYPVFFNNRRGGEAQSLSF